MEAEVYVQCSACGALHRVKNKDAPVSDDEVYTAPIWCDRCRKERKHLVVGQYKEDVYWLGDNTFDERFYIYNTK